MLLDNVLDKLSRVTRYSCGFSVSVYVYFGRTTYGS